MDEKSPVLSFASAPVTHILPADLSERTIICSGEVEDELMHAFSIASEEPELVRQYRCYKVWKYPSFTLVLAGIGTGTLEPLLWEILRPGIIKKIILIGTAGCVQDKAPALGKALPISKAWPCGTGIDQEVGLEPLVPCWSAMETLGAMCGIASSDFFYGYSDRVLDGTFEACQGAFKERYLKVKPLADLIDMEVAPFYYFAPYFSTFSALEYLAIKGSSNALGKGDEMNDYAASVMDDCAMQAMKLMGLSTRL